MYLPNLWEIIVLLCLGAEGREADLCRGSPAWQFLGAVAGPACYVCG